MLTGEGEEEEEEEVSIVLALPEEKDGDGVVVGFVRPPRLGLGGGEGVEVTPEVLLERTGLVGGEEVVVYVTLAVLHCRGRDGRDPRGKSV